MKNLKSSKRKAFGGMFVSSIFAFTTLFLPIKAITSKDYKATFADEPQNVYETTNKIAVQNSSFETVASGTFTPSSWKASAQANSDTTLLTGTLDTTIKNWDNVYEQLVNNWVNSWSAANNNLTDEVKTTYANNLKLDLMTNRQFANPNNHTVNLNSSSDNRVLFLSAGKTYNDLSNVADTTSNSGLYKYTSDNFVLSAYSYYRISVYVATQNSAKANITVSGDISISKTGISTTSSSINYYLYDWTDGTTTGQYISTDHIASPNVNDTISVNGIQYKYNGTAFVADSDAPNYQASYENYTVTYNAEKTYSTNSPSDWEKYELYISTRESSTIALELGIGTDAEDSFGTAFFDDVLVEQIQIVDYENAVNGPRTAKVSTRQSKNNFSTFEYITDTNSDSKIDLLDTEFTYIPRSNGLEGIESAIVDETLATGIEPTFIGVGANNKVLKITNLDSSAIGIKSNKVTIEQLKYYRISFWVRTDNGETYLTKNAALTTTLKSMLNDKEVSSSYSLTPYLAKTGSNGEVVQNVNNYWKEVSFYILGCPLYNTEAWFEISITKPCTLYFDNFGIEEVSADDYSNASGTKLALNTTIASGKIANGNFTKYDSVDFSDFNDPLPAKSWTAESTYKKDVYLYYSDLTNNATSYEAIEDNTDVVIVGDTATYNFENYIKNSSNNNVYELGTTKKLVLVQNVEFVYDIAKKAYYNETYKTKISANYITSGIVPTSNDTIFNNYKSSIGNITKPDGKENCLAINSTSEAIFGYKSSAITLSANTVYRISVWIWTTNDAVGTITLSSTGTNFAQIKDINTYNTTSSKSEWKEYIFYCNSGTQTPTLYLNLGIDGQGTALFKNINYTSFSSTVSFNENLAKDSTTLKNDRISIVDLSKDTFAEISNDINATTKLFDAMCYKNIAVTGSASGIWGILDTKNADIDYSSIKAKDDEVSPYVMIIKNQINQSTKIESSKAIVLSASKYYKITIYAKTSDIADGKFANISFENVSAVLNVNTLGYTNTDDNDYKSYVVYVATGDTAINLYPTISLLNASGVLLVDNISMESIEKADFETVSKDENTNDKVIVDLTVEEIDNTENEENSTDDETTEDEINSLEIFFVVLSSVILVGAILIAVIFRGAKRLPKHKRAKISKKFQTGDEDDERGFI